MAQDSRSNDEAKRSVVVEDIPPDVSEKDLTIHFLRQRNGGGQVQSITKGEESAVITFESQRDVMNVLEKQHIIRGKELCVQAYENSQDCCDSEPFVKVFARVTSGSLKMTAREMPMVLTSVSRVINAEWAPEKEGAFMLSGSLREIQKAHHHLRRILQQRQSNAVLSDLPSTNTKKSLNGDQTTAPEEEEGGKQEKEGKEDGAEEKAKEEGEEEEEGEKEEEREEEEEEEDGKQEETQDQEKNHSLLPAKYEAEPRFHAFLSRFYKAQLTELEHKYFIKISWIQTESNIALSPASSSCSAGDLRAASKAFVKLYQGVQSNMTMKNVRFKNSTGNERSAIARIAREFPVMIERSEDRTQWLLYGKEEHVTASLNELSKVCAVCDENPSGRISLEADCRSACPTKQDGTTSQFQQLLFESVKVAVCQGDLTEERVDAIVNAANEQLAHVGGLALAISHKGGPSINRESKAYIKRNGWLQVGEVARTGPGDLPCKYVIHAVGPQWRQEGEQKSRDLLRAACLNCLHEAEKLKLSSIALPAISSGIFGVPKEICAEVMFEAVEEYSAAAAQNGASVTDVRFVNIDDATVEAFRKEFAKRYRFSKESHMSSAKQVDADAMISHEPRHKKEGTRRLTETPVGEPQKAWERSKQVTKDHRREMREDKENECPVCLDTFKNPRVLKKCKHKFCKSCIDEALKVRNQCPFCKTPCDVRKGNQPPGTMTTTKISETHLPGFERHGAILVRYEFPAGTQTAGHPNPGMPYSGTTRTAYLPDNEEGNEVLKLLKRAFDARLVFTVGTSRASGFSNQIIWNDICHKTSISGGPMNYGYPDPTYIATLKADLAAKGIH